MSCSFRSQVAVKLETGDIPHLKSFLSSWCTEQQQADEGMPEWLVLDLCGRELTTDIGLELTSRCTLRNGTLQLHHYSGVSAGVSLCAKAESSDIS